jgi:hypothetical protein
MPVWCRDPKVIEAMPNYAVGGFLEFRSGPWARIVALLDAEYVSEADRVHALKDIWLHAGCEEERAGRRRGDWLKLFSCFSAGPPIHETYVSADGEVGSFFCGDFSIRKNGGTLGLCQQHEVFRCTHALCGLVLQPHICTDACRPCCNGLIGEDSC